MNINDEEIAKKIIEEKFPGRQFKYGTYEGTKQIYDAMAIGYEMTGFRSNTGIENQGVKHYLRAVNHLNQIKYVGIKENCKYVKINPTWQIINQYDFKNKKTENETTKFALILRQLRKEKYEIITIDSYFDDIKIEDPNLLVGINGTYKKKPIQIIAMNNPYDNTVSWVKTISR